MLNYTTVITRVEDMVGTITLNRPEANNTFNIPMAEELNSALREMDEDTQVNVVVINANRLLFSNQIPFEKEHPVNSSA